MVRSGGSAAHATSPARFALLKQAGRGPNSPPPCSLSRGGASALHALPGELAHPLLPALVLVLEVDCGVDVCRGVQVRVHEHGDHADQDAVHAEDRAPTLVRGLLLVEAVRARRVQDGDAHTAIRVDVGVPHLGLEFHLRRVVGKVRREGEDRAEDSSLVEAVRGTLEDHTPLEEVGVILEAHREAAALVLHELHQLALQELPRHVRHLSSVLCCAAAVPWLGRTCCCRH
mmetsp:Transcript_57672/g.130066  ORF Transcript_57672/g.130066 Transcript_57672/m.130066 type:complete len:230 (-) Transcript_57672:26-715(-)